MGFMNCGIAVIAPGEYEDLRIKLSAAANFALLLVSGLSSSTGNDIWADETNKLLAADNVHNVACVGVNVN